MWHVLRCFKREHPHDELCPGVLIGRRLLASEYPAEVQTILDLTCEFPEPRGAMRGRGYRSFPVLDAMVPSVSALLNVVGEIDAMKPPVYIHCAEGHGRTGTVAATFLLVTGRADSVDRAIAMVQDVRPLAEIRAAQRELIAAAIKKLRQEATPSMNQQE